MTRPEFLKLVGVGVMLLPAGCQEGPKEKPTEGSAGAKCSADFVNGTHQANPDCIPKTRTLDNRCTAKLYKFIYPGSKYDDATGGKLADAELKRTTDFYAKYCIDLTVGEIKLPDKEVKRFKDFYTKWYDDLINDIGGASKLGKASIPGGDRDNFKRIANTIQKYAEDEVKPKGRKLVVVFIDEYIGGSDGADTLVSATQESIMQVGINWIDSGSPYILAHELIHLLGKSGVDTVGNVTWPHSSNCPPNAKPASGQGEALSKIGRTDSRVTIDLSGRYLDVEEYKEIGTNRAARLLTCQKIK